MICVHKMNEMNNTDISIPIDGIELKGILTIPENAKGFIIFAHGSGSSRLSSRNRSVAEYLNTNGFATLLFDLLTEEEDLVRESRFNIDLLSERLVKVAKWTETEGSTKNLTNIGLFGSSTGAAAAINAATELENIKAVVSRGGRPDLAQDALPKIQSPTLLIVGGNDYGVIELNQEALSLMNCPKELTLVPEATHLFEEDGALEEVSRIATEWFEQYLK